MTACLSSGACETADDVSYVASADNGGTSNTECTLTSPCTSISAAVATAATYIHVKGAINDQVSMTTGTKILIGETTAGVMASVSTMTAGSLFTLSGTASLTIYNVDLTGALGNGVILNSGTPTIVIDRSRIEKSFAAGVLAQLGTVNVSRSTLTANAGGALDLRSANFDIENSYIVQNGTAGSAFGGISIFMPSTGIHTIDFNTIAKNVSGGSSAVNGIVCGGVSSVLTFTNNNIAENLNDPQVSGTNCNYSYSNISGAVVTSGTGNLNDDPMFIDDLSSDGNFHLKAGSPLRDMADPNSSVKVDWDGDRRPQGNRSDIGADELMP
jgi:hypothetical protein